MRIIQISGVIGYDVTGKQIKQKLDEANGEDVLIEISSPGGFVYDGLEIFNLLRDYKGNVETKLMGLAASMASYIAMAGKKVSVHDNAVFMIHNPWLFSIGDHNELRQSANHLEALSKLLAKAYMNKSNKSIDEIKSLMDAETFLYGNEIFENGFADELIETSDQKEKEEAIAVAKLSVENCIALMKESENFDNDLLKAAAFLVDNPVLSRSSERSEESVMRTDKNIISVDLSFIESKLQPVIDFIETVKKEKKQTHDHNLALDLEYFENELNQKIKDKKITPAVKEKILSIIKFLCSFEFSEPDYKIVTKNFFEMFDLLIETFPKFPDLETNFAVKPETEQVEPEVFQFAEVDSKSREIHAKAVHLMKSENLTYLSAVQKILSSENKRGK